MVRRVGSESGEWYRNQQQKWYGNEAVEVSMGMRQQQYENVVCGLGMDTCTQAGKLLAASVDFMR